MRLVRLSPDAYARTTTWALAGLTAIVVTGGAVRVTGSGLGCPDWPTCDEGRLVAPLSYHPMIEFANRTVTGLVSLAVIVAVLGALARVPRRRDLTWLSLGLVAGVVGQIFLGGLVVRYHLWPPLVMGHMVLSMVLVANAVVLRERALEPDGADGAGGADGIGADGFGGASGRGAGGAARAPARVAAAGPDHVLLGRLLLVATAVTIALGTVVTGSGPHAGSHDGELVERLPFALRDVARLHGLSVLLTIGLAVALWRSLRAGGAAPEVVRRSGVLLAVLVAQAAVGYVQYFTGVPAVLVAAHIAGATAVWIAVLRVVLGMHVVPAGARQPAFA